MRATPLAVRHREISIRWSCVSPGSRHRLAEGEDPERGNIEAQFLSSWEGQITPERKVTHDPQGRELPSGDIPSGDIPTTISTVSIVTVMKGDAGAYQVMHPTQGMFLSNFDGSATPLSADPGFQVTTVSDLWRLVDEA